MSVDTKDRHASYFGSTDIQMDIYNDSKNRRKWNNLHRKVCHRKNILFAIKRIGSNPGRNTPGPDGMRYRDYVTQPIDVIERDIMKIFNTPEHIIREVQIPKANGKYRTLGIANINVRIAQQCILNILECVTEAHFSPRSYGFRRNKSTKLCVSAIAKSVSTRNDVYIYDCDLKGYFDTIELSRCIYFLKRNHGIYDSTLLTWISNVMHCSVSGHYSGFGLAQGSVLGPVLANVMLHDWEEKLARINKYTNASVIGKEKNNFLGHAAASLNSGTYYTRYKKKHKGHCIGAMYRYADDFVIISNNEKDLQYIISRFKQWCKTNKLTINEEKSKIITRDHNGVIKLNFLGYGIKVDSNKRIIIHIKNETEKIRSIKKELRRHLRMGRADKFMSCVLGYYNYYDINTNLVKLSSMINELLYRGQYRVTACNITRERWGRFKVCNLHSRWIYRNTPFLCDVSEIRKHTNKSIADYMKNNREWNPKQKNNGLLDWIQEVLEHRNVDEYAQLTCYLPGLVSGRKKEPILGLPYEVLDPTKMVIHHITPLHLGGTNDFSNLVVLHEYSHLAVHNIKINIGKQATLDKYRKLAGTL